METKKENQQQNTTSDQQVNSTQEESQVQSGVREHQQIDESGADLGEPDQDDSRHIPGA